MKGSQLETLLALQLRAVGLIAAREFRFHPVRRWRFDFAFPGHWLAIEVEGGGYVAGRHGRGLGIENDCEKYAEALCLGWRVLRVTGRQVRSGEALRWIEKALCVPA